MLLLAIGGSVIAVLAGLMLLYPWLLTDMKYIMTILRNAVKYKARDKIIVDYFEDNVKKHPDKVAIIYKDKSYTYKVCFGQIFLS